MPMVGTVPQDRRAEAVGRGMADFATVLIGNMLEKRINEERVIVETEINEAPDFQEALSAIERAPARVRREHEEALIERAKARFPEQELVNVIDPEGNLASITQERTRPLTDEQIREQGFDPAKAFVVVSTDSEGNIEIHDSSIGMQAAEEEMERIREIHPDRHYQIAEGPETETFMQIWDRQLRTREMRAQRDRASEPSVEMLKLLANVERELANDPLATESGVIVLESKRDELDARFKAFNGQFAGELFSLESPESSALYQNGARIAATAMARGLAFEKAMDLAFNSQISGSIISNLLDNSRPGSSLATEAKKRFGVDPAQLKAATEAVANVIDQLEEYDPADPDVQPVEVPGTNIVIRFVRIGNQAVPIGFRASQ